MNAAFPETVIAANTILVHSRLIQYRLGNPAAQFDVTIMMFAAYAVFSLAGWFLVRISTALLLPVRTLTRLGWGVTLIAGAFLGRVALLFIFVLLTHDHIYFPATFTGSSALWAYSAVVSTAAFTTYALVLRRDARGKGPTEIVEMKAVRELCE